MNKLEIAFLISFTGASGMLIEQYTNSKILALVIATIAFSICFKTLKADINDRT